MAGKAESRRGSTLSWSSAALSILAMVCVAGMAVVLRLNPTTGPRSGTGNGSVGVEGPSPPGSSPPAVQSAACEAERSARNLEPAVREDIEGLVREMRLACSESEAKLGQVSDLIRRLAETVERHPESASILIESAKLADSLGQWREAMAVLTALGKARVPGLQAEVLAIHDSLGREGRAGLILAMAQDRGVSTPDPWGVKDSAWFSEITDVGEPDLRSALLQLLERTMATPGRPGDGASAEQMAAVLSKSAHRDGALDRRLLELAHGEGPYRRTTREAYLGYARTSEVRGLALETIPDPTASDGEVLWALTALGRRGPVPSDITLIATALESAATPRKACILRSLPALLSGPGRRDRGIVVGVTGILAAALAYPSEQVSGAAIRAISDCADRFPSWGELGVDPCALLRDGSLLAEDRAYLAARWMAASIRADLIPTPLEGILGDHRVPLAVRLGGWRELAARIGEKRDLVTAVWIRLGPNEVDPDIRELMDSATGGR